VVAGALVLLYGTRAITGAHTHADLLTAPLSSVCPFTRHVSPTCMSLATRESRRCRMAYRHLPVIRVCLIRDRVRVCADAAARRDPGR